MSERLTARFAPTKRSGESIQENPENKRFRVPIQFGTNRFTFKKIPPPLPLLHPKIRRIDSIHIFLMPTTLCFRHGRTVGTQAVPAVGGIWADVLIQGGGISAK